MNSASPLEQNLYSFQEQPALILEKVDDAIALLDAEQHLVLFNQKLVRILHLESVWLKQSPRFSEILAFLVEQNTWSSEQRDRALQACEHTSGENQVIQINQNDQIYLDLYITSTSTGGKLLIFRDLTAQRRAQHDLADEVRRLTFLLGLTERLQTSDNLIQIGRFALTYLVKAMGAAFGDVKVIGGKGSDRSAGKLTNLISGQFIATHGESVAETMQQRLDQGVAYGQGILWQVVETGQPCFVEDYATHPNAVKEFRHPAIGQLGIFPIPSADGTIIGVLTLESRSLQKLQEAPQQDMLLAACRTLGAAIERAQSQERLQRINQDLELASRLKSEFLASMSHELRTPLNSILGFSELLLRQREGLNSRKVGHVSLIHKSGQHLLHLINDILDLSKVEAGKVDLELNTVSIQALCRQCLQMIQPRAERKRLALSLELDYQLDQVVIDERRVRQIVINLLSNAVKFTPEKGKVKLSVQVAYGNQLLQDTRPDESPVNLSTPYLCIAVTDTGIGIEAEKKHLLFRPFQQIDASLTRRHEGTGLGLALTKRLAELHGGTVSFVSQLGEGSTFRVWLPLNELRETGRSITASVAAGSPSPDQSTSSQAQDRVAQPCVLVVEDQPYNQSLIAEILEMEGYAVNIIADGQTMLETLGSPLVTARSLPVVVLMDIQLPNIDGFELIRQLKTHPLWQSVPVIAVTAMAMAGDRDRCLAAGADAYLSKPLNFNELIQQISKLSKSQTVSEST